MPKIIAPLTANGIEKAHRLRAPRAMNDGAQPGLVFRVGKGSSSWSLLATGAAGRKRVTIGGYPEIGLAQARALAQAARKHVEESTNESNKSFRELVDAYGALEGPRLRTWDNQRNGVLFVYRAIWETPCGDLSTQALQRIADAHPARVAAARAVQALRPILKWGRKRGWTTLSAGDLETPKGTSKPRGRVLTQDELKRVLAALADDPGPIPIIMRLILLTCCRRDEIADLDWSEVDLGDDPCLRLPRERYKTDVDVVIPLSKQAAELLLSRMEPYGRVFPKISSWFRAQKRINQASNTSGWHRHDLRRTSATILAGLGYAPHVVDISLGHKHVSSALHSVYNRSRYAPEHKQALQALADYYTRLVS